MPRASGIIRGSKRLHSPTISHYKEKTMINSIKAEIERRTGLPASTVDQVLSALGGIVSERYPQYAGIIGPMLGIPTSGSPAGTSATPGGMAAGAGQGMPDLGAIEGELGKLFGGQSGQQSSPQEPHQ
jgi:hypothetical protein